MAARARRHHAFRRQWHHRRHRRDGPSAGTIWRRSSSVSSAAATGSDVTVSRFEIDGRKIEVSAAGSLSADTLAFDWQLALPDLTSVLPTLAGALQLQGRVSGPIDDFAREADLSGTLGPVGKPAGPISANAQLRGLPGKPAGSITAQGVVAGSRLDLAVAAIRAGDGGLKVTIEHADWKSAHAQGSLALPAGTRFPLGRVDLRMTRLDDLGPLIGEPITGAIAASMVTSETGGHQRADLRVEGRDIGLAGSASTGPVELTTTIVDPLTHPVLDARVVGAAKLASGIGASVQIGLAGPEDAFRLKADAEVRDPGGGNVQLCDDRNGERRNPRRRIIDTASELEGRKPASSGPGTYRVWRWSDPGPSPLGAAPRGDRGEWPGVTDARFDRGNAQPSRRCGRRFRAGLRGRRRFAGRRSSQRYADAPRRQD